VTFDQFAAVYVERAVKAAKRAGKTTHIWVGHEDAVEPEKDQLH
jgi:hypothetical protein